MLLLKTLDLIFSIYFAPWTYLFIYVFVLFTVPSLTTWFDNYYLFDYKP